MAFIDVLLFGVALNTGNENGVGSVDVDDDLHDLLQIPVGLYALRSALVKTFAFK